MKPKSKRRDKAPPPRPSSSDDNMKVGNKQGEKFTDERNRVAEDEVTPPRARGKPVDG